MPYIPKVERREIDVMGIWPPSRLAKLTQGQFTYLLHQMMVYRKMGLRENYQVLSGIAASARDAEHEFRRKVLDPYEDKMEKRNGPVVSPPASIAPPRAENLLMFDMKTGTLYRVMDHDDVPILTLTPEDRGWLRGVL